MTPTQTPPGSPNHPASGVARFLPNAVTQAGAVQPVPQVMSQAVAVQPGDFLAALDHVPVESSLALMEASVVPAHTDVAEQEAPGPVIFHTSPVKGEGKSQPSTTQAQSAKVQPPASQAMTPQSGRATSTTTRSSSSGCCDATTGCCDDPGPTIIIVNDDGSCAAAINCCVTGVLRSCQALARMPGALRDCMPSSQALHSGCDSLVTAAGQCCEGFGNCLLGGLDLCKDIITCPCTLCGQMCDACCKGLEGVDCCSCCPSAELCCCCADCDCSGCDCNC